MSKKAAASRDRPVPSPSPAEGGASPAASSADDAKAPSETQRRILAAALELFAERGYAATSTAAIAKRAGVAEKTIFANFETKDRLFDQTLTPAALELLIPDAIYGVRETLSMSWGSLGSFLSAFMHDRLAFVHKHPSKLKLIAQALVLHPELADMFVRVFREHIEPRLAAVIEHLETARELRHVPRSSLVRIVMSMTAGYMLTRFVLRPKSDWDDEAELTLMIDVLVNGLRPRA
jgi:AcrR family transcriptional regulator